MSIPEMGTAGSEPHLNTPGRPSESATDIHSNLEDLMNALAGRHDVDDDDQPAYARHTRAAEYSILIPDFRQVEARSSTKPSLQPCQLVSDPVGTFRHCSPR